MQMRLALAMSFTLLVPIAATTGIANGQAPKKSSPNIEVRLTTVQRVIHPGETLKLKVEIWNVGTEDVIIAQNIDATFGNSTLELFLEVNSALQGPNMLAVGDGIPEPNPDFVKTFVTNWLTLNKSHYYGTYVYMDPTEFPPLRKPGHYRVRAEYSSRGISSVPGWNGGYLKPEDIAKLPFQAWKGTADSNFVSIQVSGNTNKTPNK
jgi:hypothetical protein